MKVSLREVRYDWEDEDALNHCDVGADVNFELVADDTYTFGHIYISKDTETADGTPCPVYINWVEFLSIFQYKHLLRSTLNAVYDMFGEFYNVSAIHPMVFRPWDEWRQFWSAYYILLNTCIFSKK